jgi:GntR family transcriptional regulator, transcriptional repressor for pyruvate dehydrogenase complex
MMEFKTILPTTAYRGVVDQIINALLRGELKVGDRLGSEVELAAAFGVSRPTLREAIKVLCGAGVLSVKRGVTGGITVERDSIAYELLTSALRLEQQEIIDLLEARQKVDMISAELAAERASQEDIKNLARLIDQFAVGNKSRRAFASVDIKVHLAIAKAAKNERIYRMVDMLMREIIVVFDMLPITVEEWALAQRQHLATLDAIKSRDPLAARLCMHEHDDVLDKVLREFNKRNPIPD